MRTQSRTLPSAHVPFLNLVKVVMQKISAAAAQRRLRRQNQATLDLLAGMDDQLLDDIGMAPAKKPTGLDALAQMSPAYLAATVFSLPRKDRR